MVVSLNSRLESNKEEEERTDHVWVSGSGFQVQGFRIGVQGLGFHVQGFRTGVQVLEFGIGVYG